MKFFEPEKRLQTTFFISLSGLEDRPESYNLVTYALAEEGGGTRLTVSQDNNPSPESAEHSAANWATVLEGVRQLVEGGQRASVEQQK